MWVNHMTIIEVFKEAERICKKRNVEHLYLFGSYAKGFQTASSDVDFFVKGASDFSELQEELSGIPTLKKIDVINYDECTNVFLKEDMDRYGKQIY